VFWKEKDGADEQMLEKDGAYKVSFPKFVYQHLETRS
jgi:hypothetical protein